RDWPSLPSMRRAVSRPASCSSGCAARAVSDGPARPHETQTSGNETRSRAYTRIPPPYVSVVGVAALPSETRTRRADQHERGRARIRDRRSRSFSWLRVLRCSVVFGSLAWAERRGLRTRGRDRATRAATVKEVTAASGCHC